MQRSHVEASLPSGSDARTSALTPRRRHSLAFAFAAADRAFPRLCLVPAVVLFAALTLYPLANLVRMSVSTITFANGAQLWAYTPLRNLAALRADDVLVPAVINTLIFVVTSVAIEMVLGTALAITVAGIGRGKRWVRTLAVLPILVPPVAIGSMWKLMYNYDFGIFNQTLAGLGVTPVNWLGAPHLALASVIIVDVWHWVPFVFLILFAAVEGIPRDLIEAAHVDGATRGQTIRLVVLPLLKPAIVVALLFRAILAFKVFDEVYLLTAGGPGTATELVNLHLYKVFFEQNQLGYGALLSLVVIAAIVALLLVLRGATRATATSTATRVPTRAGADAWSSLD